MLRTETITIGGANFEKNYSDAGMYIRQNETGENYVEAIDIPGIFTYTETDIPISDEEATAEDYEEALNEMGVET